MHRNGPDRFGWLARLETWTGTRRHAGLLGAALFAALAPPERAPTRRKKRKPKRESAKRHGGDNARRLCGGIAGIACPSGFVCVDDPRDDCDPERGGADCGGVCVPVGKELCDGLLCGPGHYCCDAGCRRCLPVGEACAADPCPPDPPDGQPCGDAVCGEGEYCCAEHCSLCVPRGETCRDVLCPKEPDGEWCGGTRCGPEEFCCNPSCGECAPRGGACTARWCGPPAGERCGRTICPDGQVCCNASCGICTPPGGACIMIACEDGTLQ
jgi:hypothetical protein